VKVFRIEVRRPAFWEFTSASVLAIGLWMFLAALAARVDPGMTRTDLLSLLAVMWLAVLGPRFGLDARRSWTAALVQVCACLTAVIAVQALL
jgi:hypothetical protein